MNAAPVAPQAPGFLSKLRSFIPSVPEAAPVVQRSSGILSILVLITVVLITVVAGYMFYKSFGASLQTKKLFTDPVPISFANSDKVAATGDLPSLKNGLEYTMSFWFYLDEFKSTKSHKILMMRNTNGTSAGIQQIVYMDKASNKLYFALRTNKAWKQYKNINEIHADNCGFVKLAVNYVPIKRWINVTVSVDNQYASLYVDGQIGKSINVHDTDVKLNKCDLKGRTFTPTKGDLYVGGGGVNIDIPESFISKFVFSNYVLSSDKINTLYKTGPLPVKLAGVNLTELQKYRLRNPIFKPNDVSLTDEQDESLDVGDGSELIPEE